MPDKTWKKRERVAAERLGGKRIPVTGERDGADVETPLLLVQCKHGRNRPSYLSAWVDGIASVAHERGKVGLVVWSTMRERGGDALVILKLSDFEQLHGRVRDTPQ